MSGDGVAAVGLDLGSTRIKAGLFAADGTLLRLETHDSPALVRDRDRCEGAPFETVDAAAALLETIGGDLERPTPTGLSCQRSSFVLLDPTGRAATPMISWQDTRAAHWCRENRELQPLFHERSGLMLSAHYAGPKLAALAGTDAAIGRGLRAGTLRFRTLDALLIERWGGPASTDPGMAARTGLFDIETLDWSEPLCEMFGVDPACLPPVRPTDGFDCAASPTTVICAALADQSAALVGLTGADAGTVLVNLGTGAFVLRPTADGSIRRDGYLTGILRADRDARTLYALEGAISGSGPAIDRFRSGRPRLTAEDPAPDLFAIPDGAGLGAPHWRPEIGVTFSHAESSLDRTEAHRALLEGLLFRVREVFDDLAAGTDGVQVSLAGGMAAEPFLAQGLATLLDRPVRRLDVPEAALRGAAMTALPATPLSAPDATVFDPAREGVYLANKYVRWKSWLAEELG